MEREVGCNDRIGDNDGFAEQCTKFGATDPEDIGQLGKVFQCQIVIVCGNGCSEPGAVDK